MKFLDDVLFYYRWHGSNSAQNIQKMISMTKITTNYENNLLKKISVFKTIPSASFFILVLKGKQNPFIIFMLYIYKRIKQLRKILEL